MGVIYQLLNLPEAKRESFVEKIVQKEADEKLKFRKPEQKKIKLGR